MYAGPPLRYLPPMRFAFIDSVTESHILDLTVTMKDSHGTIMKTAVIDDGTITWPSELDDFIGTLYLDIVCKDYEALELSLFYCKGLLDFTTNETTIYLQPSKPSPVSGAAPAVTPTTEMSKNSEGVALHKSGTMKAYSLLCISLRHLFFEGNIIIE